MNKIINNFYRARVGLPHVARMNNEIFIRRSVIWIYNHFSPAIYWEIKENFWFRFFNYAEFVSILCYYRALFALLVNIITISDQSGKYVGKGMQANIGGFPILIIDCRLPN